MAHLIIWTAAPKSKVLSTLSVAFSSKPDFQVDVVNDFNALPPDGIILALGQEPKAALEALKLFPGNRTITSLRNRLYLHGAKKFLLSYSPGVSDVDYGKYIELQCDARMAVRVALTGSIKPVTGVYEYVDDFNATIQAIETQFKETGVPVDCAHDTETIGTDPLAIATLDRPAARFVCWQWSHKVGHSAVKYFNSMDAFQYDLQNGLYEQAEWLLNTPMISHKIANGKFDLQWHWFHTRHPKTGKRLECTNFKLDTTLVGGMLDENRSNGLDVHAKIYSNMGGYSDEADNTWDKSRMDLISKSAMLPYAGGDTDATLQVAAVEKKELLNTPGAARFYINVLHPAARAFEVIERGGMFVDLDKYKQLELDLQTEMATITKTAISILGGRLYAKHRDASKPGDINLMKASLLVDFLFSPNGLNLKPKMMTAGGKGGTGTKSPSTAMEHLLMFKNDPKAGPFVSVLDDYSSAQKSLSTYVHGFLKHLRSDNRFHASYFLFVGNRDEGEGGANTGRLSAKAPAVQTLPKHTKWGKRIRGCFTAPPGYLVLERDYSQGELRVIACIANETNMLAAYMKGMDLHALTGSGLAGMSYDTFIAMKKTNPDLYDKLRQAGKPANFGLAYEQGWEGFQVYAHNNYGVVFTDEEAQKTRSGWHKLYPGIQEYWKRQHAAAHKYLCVVSPLGRTRHLPLANSKNQQIRAKQERQSVNSPVQSTLSDMMIWALGIEQQQGGMVEAPVFAMIHDAAYDYLPEDSWEKHAVRKRALMENLPFEKVGWKPQLVFPADLKVGSSMGTLKDVKLAR